MKIKNINVWLNYNKSNKDAYGQVIIKYAVAWADLMEPRIEAGEILADIAKETSHEADMYGITEFMYGIAVFVLSQNWEYGEDLRQWHNLDCQIHNEGQEANDDGSVLNPALLNIKED